MKVPRWVGIFWIVLSVFWLDICVEKIHVLRASGKAVGGWQYGQIVLWVAMLVFWAGLTWANWARKRRP